MKKHLSIAIILAAISMSLGAAAGIKHFSKLNEPEQAQAALDDNTFLMYYAGDSDGTAKAGCYEQSTALSGNVSSNSITYATYTNYLSGFTPSSGGNNARTFTIKAASTARVVSIPVRIAINVDGGKFKTVSSFGGSISVTRNSSSSQAAKVELFKDDAFSVNSSLSSTSTGALASAYNSGSLTQASAAFTCNTVKQYCNSGTGNIPILKDFLHLVFTIPTTGSNTSYTVGINITSCTISESDTAVSYDNNGNYYSASTFPTALRSATSSSSSFYLMKNTSISEAITFSNVTRVINLNKYKINCTVDGAFVIDSGSNITINATEGSGNTSSGGIYHQLGSGNSIFTMKSGSLTINSGYYGAMTSVGTAAGYIFKSTTTSGTLTINGGVYAGSRCFQNDYGTNCYIGGGNFSASDYTIYNPYANIGTLSIFNSPTFNKPIYTARSIYLNNNNTVTRKYYTGSGFSVTLTTSLVSNNSTVVMGAESESIYDNITITNIDPDTGNSGYVKTVVVNPSFGGEYNLKLSYRTCVPVLHLNNCTLDGDIPTMTYSSSGGTYSMLFEAKYGYYFETTKGTTVVEASGLDFAFQHQAASNYLGGLFRNAYVRMNQSSVKADVEFTITPLKSSALDDTEQFIADYMYMNTYTENKDWCKDAEHHYFTDAMAAYNQTTTTATYIRQILNNSDDSAIVAAKDRLSKWAAANGYHIDTAANGYKLVPNSAQSSLINKASNTNIMVIAIVAAAMVSISVVGFVLVIKKKKHQ